MHKYRPNIMFLLKTKDKQDKLEKLRRRVGFYNAWYVVLVDLGGLLALRWCEDNVEVLSANSNIMDAREFCHDYGTCHNFMGLC